MYAHRCPGGPIRAQGSHKCPAHKGLAHKGPGGAHKSPAQKDPAHQGPEGPILVQPTRAWPIRAHKGPGETKGPRGDQNGPGA